MRRIGIEIVADYSQVTKAFNGVSKSAKNFDRELSHTTRGVVAGSGVFKGLGRSLAFASGGFLAFAGVSSAIRNSIEGAESLEKAQRGLDVAIKHTGGDLKKLRPQYEAVAAGAAKFGVNQADATVALQRATLLTGSATKAQHAYQEALVISKATGKDFNTVLTATAKGQAGITTSLRRYGILVGKTMSGQQQFNLVMGRFAGQAKANTSAIDRFNATWQNTEEILGAALLPTLNKVLSGFGKWLERMQRTGRLQRDVNHYMHVGSGILGTVKTAINGVDTVTGGLVNTLKILLGLKLVGYLRGVATQFDAVAAAEGRANASRFVPGPGNAPIPVPAAGPSLAERIAPYTISGAAAAATAARNARFRSALSRLGGFRGAVAGGFVLGDAGVEAQSGQPPGAVRFKGAWVDPKTGNYVYVFNGRVMQGPHADGFSGHAPRRGPLPTFFGSIVNPSLASAAPSLPPRPKIFTQQFSLTAREQLAQAQSALTRGSQDDVAAAKQVVARIKRMIAEGRLKGKAMRDALGVEAGALSTIWAAEDAAAQKRAAAAAKAKAKIQAQIQRSIDPPKLELALARAQALGISDTKILKKLRTAAYKALRSGKLSIQQQIDAWNQIASINQQIGDALGGPGGFHQANTRKLVAGLHLTAAQRKALRARLSQLGPGNTVPGQGTGAYGYRINHQGHAEHHHHHIYIDGKPVANSVTKHQQRRRRRSSSQRRGPNAATH